MDSKFTSNNIDLESFSKYSDVGTFIDTMTRHLFNGKGYMKVDDWQNVDVDAIQEKCGLSDYSLQNASHDLTDVAIQCPIYEISSSLEQFLRSENFRYFQFYLSVASPLVTIAVIFNIVAIIAVFRVRQKYFRHFILISLSFSDMILTASLLLKRCLDHDLFGAKLDGQDKVGRFSFANKTQIQEEEVPTNFFALMARTDINAAWQIAYILSAFGLFCLSVDNMLAIAAPFFSEKLMVHSNWTKAGITLLWLFATVFVIFLHCFDLDDSVSVQISVCIVMLMLLFAILVCYVFTCTQTHLHQVRHAELTQARNVAEFEAKGHRYGFELISRTQVRGFITTGFLVLSCLICWSPLVSYLLISDNMMATAHRFFIRYLCIALIFLHLNSVFDPVIYCLRMPDIRRSLFSLFGIHQRRNYAFTLEHLVDKNLVDMPSHRHTFASSPFDIIDTSQIPRQMSLPISYDLFKGKL